MNRYTIAAVCLLLSPTAGRGGTIFNLVDYKIDLAGDSITGTITTDGKMGTLGSNDIIAWTVAIQNGTNETTVVTDDGVYPGVDLLGLNATPTSLSIPAGDYLDLYGFGWLVINGSGAHRRPMYFAEWSTAPDLTLSGCTFLSSASDPATINPISGYPGDWTIATTAVPEPNTGLMISVMVTAMLIGKWLYGSRQCA
jgi:hypothetical protein